MFRDITAPYHFLESWFYDRAVAPAVAAMLDERHDLLSRALEAVPAGGRLLDVGCGGGQLLATLAGRRPGWRMTGIDLSPDQAGRAARRLAPGRPISFVTGSALRLPFRDAAFDGVVSVGSIKHWADRARGLRECLRVLRLGGAIAVLEVERDHRREDRRAFVARQRVPAFLRPAAAAGFAWKVAARSLPMAEAVGLFDALPVAELAAAPVPGMPFWMVSAAKAG